MNKLNLLYSFVLLLAITMVSCTEDGIDQDLSFLNTANSANYGKIFDISNDNSGNVKITPTGEGVTSFSVIFGHGTAAPVKVMPGNSTTYAYPEGTYTVKITASNIAGQTVENSYPLTVTYRAPENIVVTRNIAGYNLTVSATALYAKSFLVYYGAVANEVGKPMAIGQTLPAYTYPVAGNYNLKIVALSGGAATSQIIVPITIYEPFGLPITFDNPFVNYFFGTFDDWGQQQFATVDNPFPSGLNTTAKVGKFTNGHAGWSGTYSPLNNPIDFALGTKIKVLVYNPDTANIGKKLNIELEWAVGGTPANGVAVLKMPFTTSGAWEELVFDFGSISGIPAGSKFTQLVLRFNDTQDGTQEIFYVDNFRLTN
ncbi:MAG: hypothetical protein Q8S44_02920 [Flavobacteriaceae bacterium]|nr:hypothetical protein [Flavobacteriaceae bacterium]